MDTPHSTVTIFRREQLCAITSGAISTIAPITHIVLGAGGIDSSGNPIDPTEDQTTLNAQVAVYPVESVTYPLLPNTAARYTISVSTELVGQAISEAGLLDANGNLCAVRNFLAYPVQNSINMIFQFDDEF